MQGIKTSNPHKTLYLILTWVFHMSIAICWFKQNFVTGLVSKEDDSINRSVYMWKYNFSIKDQIWLYTCHVYRHHPL